MALQAFTPVIPKTHTLTLLDSMSHTLVTPLIVVGLSTHATAQYWSSLVRCAVMQSSALTGLFAVSKVLLARGPTGLQ